MLDLEEKHMLHKLQSKTLKISAEEVLQLTRNLPIQIFV